MNERKGMLNARTFSKWSLHPSLTLVSVCYCLRAFIELNAVWHFRYFIVVCVENERNQHFAYMPAADTIKSRSLNSPI